MTARACAFMSLLLACNTPSQTLDGGADAGADASSFEPPGMTVLGDRPFDSTTPTYAAGEDGWWDNGLAIIGDPTAPKSPANVGSIDYASGYAGGTSPASTELNIGVATLYVAAWVKFSSNWQSHSSGVNKILHLWIEGDTAVGGNKLVITAAGLTFKGDSPLTARISLQGIVAGGNETTTTTGDTGTYESTAEFTRGQWHKIEVVAVRSSGTTDGSVMLYLDGALATQCAGVQFVTGAGKWDRVQWSPTWGGTGDTVAADQSMYMDHIYVSGKN